VSAPPLRAPRRTQSDEVHARGWLTHKAAHDLDELKFSMPSKSGSQIIELALAQLLNRLLSE
jgi:hypothetical protein